MKRWAFGFIVFPVALLTGLFAFHIVSSRESNIGVLPVEVPRSSNQVVHAAAIASSPDHYRDENVFFESFIERSLVGRPGKNMVEIRCFDRGNGMIAEIRFYTQSRSGVWEQKQLFEFEKDTLTGCDPEVADFNNDGLNDLTYRSSVAARGANEIRTLFIYDKLRDELVRIKNSEDFPNLAYNRKLNCLDAWLFHGATTTVFLRLEGDTLREFASVDTGLELVAQIIDEHGRGRIISRKKMKEEDIYTRYSDFNPPTPGF